MADIFVIIDTVSDKFIERDKVVIWNTGSLENARTWSDRDKAEIQAISLNRQIVRHNEVHADMPGLKIDAKFEVRPATLTLV